MTALSSFAQSFDDSAMAKKWLNIHPVLGLMSTPVKAFMIGCLEVTNGAFDNCVSTTRQAGPSSN
jgi:hypothetical protein